MIRETQADGDGRVGGVMRPVTTDGGCPLTCDTRTRTRRENEEALTRQRKLGRARAMRWALEANGMRRRPSGGRPTSSLPFPSFARPIGALG